uniref:Uncharacterized protein n=1 Tax=Tetranychus urticae TaxID=32264 RepID=T1JYX8_TETUR
MLTDGKLNDGTSQGIPEYYPNEWPLIEFKSSSLPSTSITTSCLFINGQISLNRPLTFWVIWLGFL